MNLKITIPDSIETLGVAAVDHWRLNESLHDHSHLEATVRFRDPRDRVLLAIGGQVELYAGPDPSVPIFCGVLSNIRASASESQIVAQSRVSVGLDLVERTRSFSSSDGQPVRITKLSGFLEAFRERVNGLNQLRLELPLVTQFQETDWQFLKRLASVCGCFLAKGPDGSVSVCGSAKGPSHELTAELFSDSESPDEVCVSLTSPRSECRHWNWWTAESPEKAAQQLPVETGVEAERKAVCRGAALAGNIAASSRYLAFAGGRSNTDTAKSSATSRQADAFRWKASLNDPTIGCGDQVHLPAQLGLPKFLRVIRREVSFRVQSSGNELVNRIECVLDAVGIPSLPTDHPTGGPVLSFGLVVSVKNRYRTGLVKVRTPWCTTNEGVWCQVPQACAGKNGIVSNLPAPDDWVVVLLDVTTLMPPVVLGSVLPGERTTIPDAVKDPESQRLLLSSGANTMILVDDKGNETRVKTIGRIVLEGKEVEIVADKVNIRPGSKSTP